MSDKEIDKAVYANLDSEGVLRVKVVEYTIEFLKDRQISNFSAFNDVFEKIYNSLKNGVVAEKTNGNNR